MIFKNKKALMADMWIFIATAIVVFFVASYVFIIGLVEKVDTDTRIENLENKIEKVNKEILMLNYLRSNFNVYGEEINVGEYIGITNFFEFVVDPNIDNPPEYDLFIGYTKNYFSDALQFEDSSWYLKIIPIQGINLINQYKYYGENPYLDLDELVLYITPNGYLGDIPDYIYASQIIPKPDKNNYLIQLVKTVPE